MDNRCGEIETVLTEQKVFMPYAKKSSYGSDTGKLFSSVIPTEELDK